MPPSPEITGQIGAANPPFASVRTDQQLRSEAHPGGEDGRDGAGVLLEARHLCSVADSLAPERCQSDDWSSALCTSIISQPYRVRRAQGL